jgi:dihydrofolate synthase/folylpolyglutamate synthase
MGFPHWKFRSIHVGGTNGKGSVSSLLCSILREAGYRKVGLYTSPHLLEFTERIRLDGQEISPEAVVRFVARWRSLIEEVQPSFFELTVAMAFEYFAAQQSEIAVIEVGLGGRLDSTNIIRPELSVITNISYDHMDLLGETLTLIAGEKAGIIKPYTPVVIGERGPESAPVFLRKAEAEGAPIFFASDRFAVSVARAGWEGQFLRAEDRESGAVSEYYVGLAGRYQQKNLATVLEAVARLREEGWEISEEALRRGLERVVANSGLRGRMETLAESPRILCDTGHNLAGVQDAMEQVAQMPCRRLRLVWGMVRDKEHEKILPLLPESADYYYVTPSVPRGLPSLSLQLKAEALGRSGRVFDSVAAGIEAALADAQPDDLIFIGGSTFVVADALAWQRDRSGVLS